MKRSIWVSIAVRSRDKRSAFFGQRFRKILDHVVGVVVVDHFEAGAHFLRDDDHRQIALLDHHVGVVMADRVEHLPPVITCITIYAGVCILKGSFPPSHTHPRTSHLLLRQASLDLATPTELTEYPRQRNLIGSRLNKLGNYHHTGNHVVTI